MKRKFIFAILVILLVGLFSLAFEVRDVKAATRNFSLFGAFNQGWGFTSTSITSPGPTISVDQGDLVNLTLTSQDGFLHQFFVDYNGNSVHDAGEPESASFTATTNFSFTADTNGTFTYRCAIHPSVMYGTFKVNQSVPEFQSSFILPLFMAATLIAAFVYARKKTAAKYK